MYGSLFIARPLGLTVRDQKFSSALRFPVGETHAKVPYMRLRSLRRVLVLTTFLLSAGAVYADTSYIYTGMDFTNVSGPYTVSDFISFTMTLAAPLGDDLVNSPVTPLSFTFSDGNPADDLSTASITFFHVYTNASGAITQWEFDLNLSDGSTVDSRTAAFDGTFDEVLGVSGRASNSLDPGSWSVPEPSSVGLMILGSVLLIGTKKYLQTRDRSCVRSTERAYDTQS